MKQMLALALAVALGIAQAQEYPTKPIRVLVPFAPGGAVDTTARVLALAMQQRVNWQFVIENRPGGNGFIATTAVAKAADIRGRPDADRGFPFTRIYEKRDPILPFRTVASSLSNDI